MKTDSNREVEKFRAKNVGGGYKKTEEVDNTKTSAPPIIPETFEILFVLAAKERFF